jgi:lysophospholipase L1-like esterase
VDSVLIFGWKKTLVYSLLPTILVLALLEGGARVLEIWRPPWKVDYGWGFDKESRLFVPSPSEPGVMITNPSKEVSFQKQRFILPKPPKCFRVFFLGESSVNYLLYLLEPLADRLTEAFHSQVEFEIIDVGGLAYGTHRLTPIAAELLNYNPDLLLVYVGHNEFEELEQSQFVNLKTLPLQKILYRSAFCRLIRDTIGALDLSRVQRERNREILGTPQADYMTGARHAYTPEEIAQRMDAFRRNLSLIIEMYKAKNVPVMLGSVASNMWKPDLPPDDRRDQVRDLYAAGKYAEGYTLARQILRTSGRHQASDAENGIIRELARKYGAPLADVERAVIDAEPHHVPGETLHDDRCHLNEIGKKLLIQTYEDTIIRLLKDNPALLRR